MLGARTDRESRGLSVLGARGGRQLGGGSRSEREAIGSVGDGPCPEHGAIGSLGSGPCSERGTIRRLGDGSRSKRGAILSLSPGPFSENFPSRSTRAACFPLHASLLRNQTAKFFRPMKPAFFDSGLKWGDPNLRWGSPSFVLQEGDPGYVPPPGSPAISPRKNKKHQHMANNPTPEPYNELLAAGEDLCDGLDQHAVIIGVKQNTFVIVRAELDLLIGAQASFKAAEGAQPAAYAALRSADSNAKGFIARAIKLLSISLGNAWSDVWLATGLPDNTVGIPKTQDGRFAAIGGLKAYFLANPGKEVSDANVNVTAAVATTLYTAVSNARTAVGNALKLTKDKLLLRDSAMNAFRKRYRGTVDELIQILSDEDPRWYDFGLNRPADPAQPGVPTNVHGTALGGARALIQIDGARRANSFNYYKQVVGVDAQPVKLLNDEGTQHTFENLPVGATVIFTVTGVNGAGEGQPSEPVALVIT